MPPLRTLPAAKPIKTERTHEENQERAYIAASRRSDRSLEARIESARRASEIHKRRTGRSLRVTEQDVINEEMYEEEDDDLPMQFRRLTAHLQIGDSDFNRRVSSYLANQIAMRTSIGQALAGAWQQQNSPLQNFMNPGTMQMPLQGFQNSMPPPPQQMVNRSPMNYRQSPYPLPDNQRGKSGIPARSASIASPNDLPIYQHQQQSQSAQTSPTDTMKPLDRRLSLPAQNWMPNTPQSTSQSASGSPVASRATDQSSDSKAFVKQEPTDQQNTMSPSQYGQSQFGFPYSNMPMGAFPTSGGQELTNMNINPLTMSLPMESQQLLAGSPWFDSNPYGSSGMMPPGYNNHNNSKQSQQSFYSYNPNGKGKTNATASSPTTGLTQTLAPAMLDTNMNNFLETSESGNNDSVITPFTPASFAAGFNENYFLDPLKDGNASGTASGNATPPEGDWQGFLQHDIWDDQAAA